MVTWTDEAKPRAAIQQLGSDTAARPTTARPEPPTNSSYSGTEPFELRASEIADRNLQDKWTTVLEDVASEAQILAPCLLTGSNCGSAAARQFAEIITLARLHTGRAKLGEVNRAINLAMRRVSDMAQYGVADFWASPLRALEKGAGDCEDFAIAKYVALRAAGIADRDLELLIVHDQQLLEDHAIVAARLDTQWLILDNRRLPLLGVSPPPNTDRFR